MLLIRVDDIVARPLLRWTGPATSRRPRTATARSCWRLFYGGCSASAAPSLWGTFNRPSGFYSHRNSPTGTWSAADADLADLVSCPPWSSSAWPPHRGTEAVINTYGTGLDTSFADSGSCRGPKQLGLPCLARHRTRLSRSLLRHGIEPSVTNVLTLLAQLLGAVDRHPRHRSPAQRGELRHRRVCSLQPPRNRGPVIGTAVGINIARSVSGASPRRSGCCSRANTWFHRAGRPSARWTRYRFVLAGLIAGALYPLVGRIDRLRWKALSRSRYASGGGIRPAASGRRMACWSE